MTVACSLGSEALNISIPKIRVRVRCEYNYSTRGVHMVRVR